MIKSLDKHFVRHLLTLRHSCLVFPEKLRIEMGLYDYFIDMGYYTSRIITYDRIANDGVSTITLIPYSKLCKDCARLTEFYHNKKIHNIFLNTCRVSYSSFAKSHLKLSPVKLGFKSINVYWNSYTNNKVTQIILQNLRLWFYQVSCKIQGIQYG